MQVSSFSGLLSSAYENGFPIGHEKDASSKALLLKGLENAPSNYPLCNAFQFVARYKLKKFYFIFYFDVMATMRM
jgi:hypothetical protein